MNYKTQKKHNNIDEKKNAFTFIYESTRGNFKFRRQKDEEIK